MFVRVVFTELAVRVVCIVQRRGSACLFGCQIFIDKTTNLSCVQRRVGVRSCGGMPVVVLFVFLFYFVFLFEV